MLLHRNGNRAAAQCLRAAMALALAGAAMAAYGQNPPRGQQEATDDSLAHELGSVVILPASAEELKREHKPLASLDRYLEGTPGVNMVRRGAFAWEPLLNGMATERSVITVDGMRIYGACTDKMDPITSYVESTNLSRARIKSGSSGSTHGATVAGSIDLERRREGFGHKPVLGGKVFAGFEGNNAERIGGTAMHYSDSTVYVNVDATYRRAGNYKAGYRPGMDREVEFSQYAKYNVSAIAGYRLRPGREVEASLIYDKATDVGYPALGMDVSLARAVIGSLQYRYMPQGRAITLWETKVYYNTVTHIMDDSKRPVVAMRMDMPGWTTTGGGYSKVHFSGRSHQANITFSAHASSALAEMTMYPDNPRERPMFMLTWPDVLTRYGGVQAEDRIGLGHGVDLSLHGGAALHENRLESMFGMRSLQLFHPDLSAGRTRLLPNVGGALAVNSGRFTHRAGFGYSERAPSVSEAYGYFLLNVSDNFDYMGNPDMRNESAFSMEWSSAFREERFDVEWAASWFEVNDYIIGKPVPGLMPMDLMAAGVKVYTQLPHAVLLNAALTAQYRLAGPWQVVAEASYRYGQASYGTRLPLIQPFQYKARLHYEGRWFNAEAALNGSAANRNSAEFGEMRKPAYAVVGLAMGKDWGIGKNQLTLKTGVDNLLDEYYSTFADWQGIPRPGRNIYGHLIFSF